MESRIPAGAKNRDTFDPLYPSQRLGKILAGIDVPYIDLTERFLREQKAGKLLYHEHDLHWNPEGHQLAADIIWESLVSYLE